jgi:hypothetical protein
LVELLWRAISPPDAELAALRRLRDRVGQALSETQGH